MKKLRDILEQKRSFPDIPPTPNTMQKKLELMRMKSDAWHDNFNKKMTTEPTPLPSKAEVVPNNIFTGSRYGDEGIVPNQDKVTPDKPLVGSDDAVGKLLASKGYSRTGEKPNENSKRSFPDRPPAPNTMQKKLELMRMDSDNWFKNLNKKMDTPPQKSIPSSVSKLEPKVGSLVATQSGYPAAEKPKAPIPTPKPPQDVRVVSKGDTLWDIAGGDPKEVKRLRQLNPKLNPSKMPVGYKLKLK